MPLTAGSRVGSYTIVGSLGAGGMGEVYRARDSKLNRDVALKVLPEAVAADPERLARFEREAQVLAALNHPNIAHIHGFEESASGNAIVMELVDGPTLADRLGEGPLPFAEALPLARQIADALEAAHEHGIVHRDLKPANIKVRDDGTVKVLDFGLAKALSPDGPGQRADLSMSPTVLSPAVTRHGIVLGTASFMSPEQAKGKAVDKRADVWAFGCVLFEMLTGRPLFAGDTVSETIASVLRDAPNLGRLPPETPVQVRRLLERCLDRDPRMRLRDIGEARIALSRPEELDLPVVATPAPGRRHLMIGGAAVASVLVAAVAAAVAWRAKPEATIPLRRFELPTAIASAGNAALAPDGSRIAYVANGHLHVHSLVTATASDLGLFPAGAGHLFWSADSRSLGFAEEGQLETMPATGGPSFAVCSLPGTGRITGAAGGAGLSGLAWRADGTIFIAAWRGSLYSVPASGGTPAVRLAIDASQDVDFHSVSSLPDGRLLVTRHLRAHDGMRAELVDGDTVVPLIDTTDIEEVRFVAPDHVLFTRRGANAGIWAVRMGTPPLDLGKAVRIAAGRGYFDVADDGTLMYGAMTEPDALLVWADRSGAISPIVGTPTTLYDNSLALDPGGRRVAFAATSGSGGAVVTRDLVTGADTRLTFDSSGGADAPGSEYRFPSWLPDGSRLLYVVGPVEGTQAFMLDPSRPAEKVKLGPALLARVSPDGHQLYAVSDERGRYRLHRASLEADGRIGPALEVLRGPQTQDVGWFDISSDGRLMVYRGRQGESQWALWLTELSDPATRWQVTTDSNGHMPQFSQDATELFYVDQPAGKPSRMMVVPLKRTPSFALGTPRALFEVNGPGQPSARAGFDIAPDGRFLMSQLTEEAVPRLTLIQNWPAILTRRPN